MCPMPGYVTPSGIKKMCTGGRGKGVEFGKTANRYAQELALERIGVEVPDHSGGWAIDWGNEWEFAAIEAYEAERMCKVHSQQVFQYHPDYDHVGGTPDGLIGKSGGMDAKCPFNMTNHMMNLLENMQLDDYEDQFQGYLWITGRDWWDFCSYDPRFEGENEHLGLHIHRVERDEKRIQEIDDKYQKFESIIQGYVDRLLEIKSNKSAV